MTTQSSTEPTGDDPDQKPYPFGYGHGRMPFFMKLTWLGFLAFSAWYVVTYLLAAFARDIGTN
jgi:hypothetical protein